MVIPLPRDSMLCWNSPGLCLRSIVLEVRDFSFGVSKLSKHHMSCVALALGGLWGTWA